MLIKDDRDIYCQKESQEKKNVGGHLVLDLDLTKFDVIEH